MKKLMSVFVVLSVVFSALLSVYTLPVNAEETPVKPVDSDPEAAVWVSKRQEVRKSGGGYADLYVRAYAYKSGSKVVAFSDMTNEQGIVTGGPITYEVNYLYIYNDRLYWALQIKFASGVRSDVYYILVV